MDKSVARSSTMPTDRGGSAKCEGNGATAILALHSTNAQMRERKLIKSQHSSTSFAFRADG